MLKELLELEERLQQGEEPTPVGYKRFGRASPIRWILHINPETGELLGEPQSTEIGHKPRPARQRSGKISATNLKPYLLVDEARYVLGIAEPGKEKEAELVQGAFLDLLRQAGEETGLTELKVMHQTLAHKIDRRGLAQKIGPREVVTCQVGSPSYSFEKLEVQGFWRNHLEKEFGSALQGQCSICGEDQTLIQTLPLEVVVMGQKCQITSFNKAAFTSFGKEQTLNASLCLRCGMFTAQGLENLLKNPQHRTVLLRDDSRGAGSPLRNQMAVYWLKEPARVTVEEQEFDLLSLSTAILSEQWEEPEVEATLAILEKLLKIPWSGAKSPLNLPDNAFYLAVLSANKGRLVVREWIAASLVTLKEKLRRFLSGLRLVGPQGDPARAFPVPILLQALGEPNPNLVRGLLRTAYLGAPPPPGLLEAAVKRLRTPRGRELSPRNKQPAAFHVLAAVIKLALTFGTKEAETMAQLNPQHLQPAYLCGRLLAVLEEAQRRAAGGKLNTTLVDRFYGAAATAPAASFAPLLKLAQTAHLPKVRREQRGYQKMNEAMTEIMAHLDGAGGFPRTLSLMAQAEFALGFYHQRAALAARPKPEHE